MEIKKKKCKCCGEDSLPLNSVYEICPVCGWQDDDIQNDDPDFGGDANDMSLNQAIELFEKSLPLKTRKFPTEAMMKAEAEPMKKSEEQRKKEWREFFQINSNLIGETVCIQKKNSNE